MNSHITILPAAEKDAAALSLSIAHLISNIPYYNATAKAHEIERYSSSALLAKINNDPLSVILAREQDALAGFCISRFDDYTIWLEWFGVTEAYRGRAVTRLLLEALEDSLPARGCHKIWCDCLTSNTAAIHVLSTAGYSQIVTLRNHWYGQDFILWEKIPV
jgi:ribosomal protein S18 acetylase RimI-like enzyme